MSAIRPSTAPMTALRAAAILFGVSLYCPVPTRAAEFNIPDGDVPALIAAINTANSNGEADTINLAAGGMYLLSAADNVNASDGPNGLPVIATEIEIVGNGAVVERNFLGPPFRFFQLATGGALAVTDATFRNGYSQGSPFVGSGGAFYVSRGSLSLSNVIIENCVANGDGGAIVGHGTLTDCAILNNTAIEFGGGLSGEFTMLRCDVIDNVSYRDGGGLRGGIHAMDCQFLNNYANEEGGGISNRLRSELESSTVSGNHARWSGGGISNCCGGLATPADITIVNSTITSNVAGNHGGGIYIQGGRLTVKNCTMSHNEAADGGGFYRTSFPSVSNVSNSIIANSIGGDCVILTGATFGDNGYNIVEDGSCIGHATSFGGDPMLDVLTNNGGPTMTQALLPGSSAIDAGDCAAGTVLVDQRGISRPQRGGCDIGAFEAEVPCDTTGCPAGTIPLVDAQGDFAGWCVGSSDPNHTDIYVDSVTAQRATIEISKDFVVRAPITLTFQQVCADDTAAVPEIVIADESLTNLTGVDWPDFAWLILYDHVWFDVPASSQFSVSPPFATRFFEDFLDPPANQQARALHARDGVVPPYSSFFPGDGTGSLKIVADLAASEQPIFFELVETSTAIHLRGDMDADGDVDTRDFATFSQCFGGPGRSAAPGCTACDLDSDGDVDTADFVVFAQLFTGAR